MGKENNFKVKCVKTNKHDWHSGGIYEFKNGLTTWDKGESSRYYKDIDDFLNYMNDEHDYFEEYIEELKQSTKEKSYTISDILLTDKFKDGQKFKFKLKRKNEINEHTIILEKNMNGDSLYWKNGENNYVLLDSDMLQAEYYPIQEKQYIETKAALEKIQKGEEVYCEVDDNVIKFNNPNTKKIQIDYILNGMFYILK